MTFSALTPRQMRRTEAVCVSLSKRRIHGRNCVQFQITFSSRFLADMKWKVGERFEVAVGEGSDAGYVRIRPDTGGYLLKHSGQTSKRPRISLNYWGDEQSHPAGPCAARPDTISRTLTIELPWQKRIRAVA